MGDMNYIPAPSTDATLLRRFRQGEQSAATELYLRYARRLERMARQGTGRDLAAKVDPESIVQSVFRSFFRRAQEGQYEVAEGEELWNLFLVIALNKIRSKAVYHHAQRRDSRRTQAMDPQALPGADRREGSQNSFEILKLTIEDLLNELPASAQQIVLMRIDGHELEAIASGVGRSKRSVERVLMKFRQRLAQIVFDANTAEHDR